MTTVSAEEHPPAGTVNLSDALHYWRFCGETEALRRYNVAVALRQRYSSVPWQARRAEQDPLYWIKFCDTRPNWSMTTTDELHL